MKNQILENIKSKQYWPNGMTHPDQYRVFYWAPDMSFCGFAANRVFGGTTTIKKVEPVSQLMNEFKKQTVGYQGGGSELM